MTQHAFVNAHNATTTLATLLQHACMTHQHVSDDDGRPKNSDAAHRCTPRSDFRKGGIPRTQPPTQARLQGSSFAHESGIKTREKFFITFKGRGGHPMLAIRANGLV